MERYGQKETDAKMAQREEKIEKLKSSIQSLFHHMPALSFSKDMETGVYLACNQAFARYAGRETPAEVAGLTDYEIFDPVTAAHFVSDDAKAISMDTPYIFFEDVPDAHGDQRQFQTTKLKFTDETGRPCLLGMCMDVTEVIKARKENEQARTAYQEAMSTNAIYENIVDALFENYFNLYYVDVETDEYIEYGSRTEAGKRTTEKHGSDFSVCASLGILDKKRLQKIKEAGASRVANNLETSERYFSEICSTHSYKEKIDYIKSVKEAGLELCSGGILGMGESVQDRIDFAIAL